MAFSSCRVYDTSRVSFVVQKFEVLGAVCDRKSTWGAGEEMRVKLTLEAGELIPINNSRTISCDAFRSTCSSRERQSKTLRSRWCGFWQMLRWMDNPTFRPVHDLNKRTMGETKRCELGKTWLRQTSRCGTHLPPWKLLFGILNRVCWRLEELAPAGCPSLCWWRSASLWCPGTSGGLWASTSRWIRGRFWCRDRAWRQTAQCQLCQVSPERTASCRPTRRADKGSAD